MVGKEQGSEALIVACWRDDTCMSAHRSDRAIEANAVQVHIEFAHDCWQWLHDLRVVGISKNNQPDKALTTAP